MQSMGVPIHRTRLRSILTFLEHLDYAITHGLTPFVSMQNHYNLLYREEEREMMPTLEVRDNLKTCC